MVIPDPGRVVLYSAIYGGYDQPKPLPDGLDVPAIMLTDRLETARAAAAVGWEPYVVRHGIASIRGNPAKLAPTLAHKWWKLHPGLLPDVHEQLSNYIVRQVGSVGVALWVDGSITITTPHYAAECLAALGHDDLALTPHPWRQCAIAEGEYCTTLSRFADMRDRIREQTEFYSRFHPRRWGLFATGAMAWRINERTRVLGNYWWEECLTWSVRDQISLPVLLRLADTGQLAGMEGQLRWNKNLPWEQWWTPAPHAAQ